MLRRKLKPAVPLIWKEPVQLIEIMGLRCYNIAISENINRKNLSNFLYKIEFIFQKIDLPIVISFRKDFIPNNFSFLITYMIMKATCKKDVCPNKKYIVTSEEAANELTNSGFLNLYIGCIEKNDALVKSQLKRLVKKQITNERLYILPQPLMHGSNKSQEKIVDSLLKKICCFYYQYNNFNAFYIIACCITEVISNFWSHADDPEDTIIFINGDSKYFHFYIADIGIGIISNLSPVLNISDFLCLKKCVNDGVSSKKSIDSSFHMGKGLFLIRKIVEAHRGELNIWSEGYHLLVKQNRIDVEPCGYWKGTILEMRLKINHAKSMPEIMGESYGKHC